MHRSLLSASLFALALSAPLVAHAHEAGDIIVRAGVARVSPNEDSGNLKLDGTKVSGTKATLEGDTQLGLTLAYMLTDHVGLELLAATPFRHEVGAEGFGPALDGKLGDIEQLPPTLSLQYYPLDAGSTVSAIRRHRHQLHHLLRWQPDRRAQGVEGFSNMRVKDSVGLAGQLGADYMLTDRVMLNASVWYIDMSTDGTIDGPTASALASQGQYRC